MERKAAGLKQFARSLAPFSVCQSAGWLVPLRALWLRSFILSSRPARRVMKACVQRTSSWLWLTDALMNIKRLSLLHGCLRPTDRSVLVIGRVRDEISRAISDDPDRTGAAGRSSQVPACLPDSPIYYLLCPSTTHESRWSWNKECT